MLLRRCRRFILRPGATRLTIDRSLSPTRVAPFTLPQKTLTAGEMCNAYLAHLKGEDWDLKPPKKVRNGGGKGGQDTGAGAGASSSSSSSSAAASSNPPPAKKGRGAGAGGSVSDKQYKAAKDVIEGLRVYFDRAFPVFLLYRWVCEICLAGKRLLRDGMDYRITIPSSLYVARYHLTDYAFHASSTLISCRFERPYFEAAYREHLRTKYTAASRTVYSEICSPEHFLRLFPKLPDLLAHANINKEVSCIRAAVPCLRQRMRLLWCHHGSTQVSHALESASRLLTYSHTYP